MSHDRPITVGVVGVRRGRTFARGSEAATGLRLVALCDAALISHTNSHT